MSTARVYLFDLDRPAGQKELKDHPFNGAQWLASGPMAKDASGAYVDGTIREVVGWSPRTVKAIERGEAQGEVTRETVEFGNRIGAVTLSAASFPGRRIRIKVWIAGEILEFRLLQADAELEHDCEEDGCEPLPNQPECEDAASVCIADHVEGCGHGAIDWNSGFAAEWDRRKA